MKEQKQLKSEKITINLRERLYRMYWNKHQKQSEMTKIYGTIIEAITEAQLKNFFKNEEDLETFKKIKSAFSLSYVSLCAEDFGIDLKSMKIDVNRKRGSNFSNYSISINEIPISESITKWKDNLCKILEEQGIKESIINLIKDYVRLVNYNNSICDKYIIGMPHSYWRECEYFCSDCKTTLQLKTKYPEIYELYLETVPFLLDKEERINNLRSKLGFI